eukprot:797510-Karenia_brevis.AAC.1
MDILFGGDFAFECVPQLDNLVRQHNDSFLGLYDIQLAKTKFHTFYHLAPNLAKFKVNVNCFKPERQHQSIKQHAAHAKQPSALEYTVLTRVCVDILASVPKQMFVQFGLQGPLQDMPMLRVSLLHMNPDIGQAIT